MCGLFGHTGISKSNLNQAHAALNCLTHRGPDAGDHRLVEGVYLGQRRLAIIDLSDRGIQPMVTNGPRGKVSIAANGEIYNYKTLRAELIANHGAKFHSDSDSEVLLHGYIHWGITQLMERVDGMFALTVHDEAAGKIILARDHAGIKPLYYSIMPSATGNTTFGWASELKALTTFYGEENLTINHTAVYDFLTYLCIPSPKSLYNNIFKLEPASYAIIDLHQGTLTKTRYWHLPIGRTITDEHNAKQLVQDALTQTVQEQVVADVPVGTFLSGGVDSSIISFETAQCVKNLITCSISFPGSKVDETPYAEAVAKLIGSTHKAEALQPNTIAESFPLLKSLMDEPFADTSLIPTYHVSALAKKHMTVVLTGDGGDELFGGYSHYQRWFQRLTPAVGILFPLRKPVAYLKARSTGRLHQLLRALEIFTIRCPLTRLTRLRDGLLPDHPIKVKFRQTFGIPDTYDDNWYTRQYYREDLPPRSRAMYLDFHTFMTDSILTKVDRASMAVAIETRVPFLSKRVIAAAWQIAEPLHFQGGHLKSLLKSLYANRLPYNCLYRTKQGFSIPAIITNRQLKAPGMPLSYRILATFFPNTLPDKPHA